MAARFRNRTDAGRRLAGELMAYADDPDVRVLALPRGGVPVGFEVARALRAPLDVFIVRKLGVPGHEEFAMGALATGGVGVLNEDVIEHLGVTGPELQRVINAERRELERRERLYRGERGPPDVAGRKVILVDDGLATGSTMRAAVEAVRVEGPRQVVVAVPIAAPETCEAFQAVADDIVCSLTPEPFLAVGLWYDDFAQTSDEEVRALLEEARETLPATAPRRGMAPDATTELRRER
jgi:predicted phosphoribosyltransferase